MSRFLNPYQREENEVVKICLYTDCCRQDKRFDNACNKWPFITSCTSQRRNEKCFIKTTKKLVKVTPPHNNAYNFRGPINLIHITNDCIKDGKQAFMAIQETRVIFGISRQVNMKLLTLPPAKRMHDTYLPFHVFEAERKHIGELRVLLPIINQLIKRQVRKTAKTLHKAKQEGKFSNAPETRVVVF